MSPRLGMVVVLNHSELNPDCCSMACGEASGNTLEVVGMCMSGFLCSTREIGVGTGWLA